MAPSFNAERDGDVALVGNFVVWAMALVSGIFLGVRVYIRQARNQLSWDDHALVGGWVFTIAQSAVFAEMLRRGFAKATIAEPTILLLMLIGDNLQKFALSLTKLSFSLTLLRIFPSGWQRWTIIALLLVINSYYIAHLFLVWLNICDHPQANRIETSCLHPTNGIMLQVVGAFLSASSDFILAFLPLTRMLEVTLKSHDKWVAAVITTSIGVIAGLAGLVKGFEGIRLLDYESTRYFHSIWVFHIVGIAEPNATIVACSIPILRTFFRTQRACHGTVLPRGMGPYVASDNAGKFPGGGGSKIQDKHQSSDTFSESESKKNAQKQLEQERRQQQQEEEAAAEADAPGIMRTRTVAVTYDDNMIGAGPPPGTADIEMLSRSAPT
ncbi:uncharacterized protein PG986_001240 [Apiospora aurea]|uniref:Rhodopsin domain-containing protein n=1 Tax=Apiospora aurea TaxID=335848 RepID=A0ABR1QX12_9PEZI